MYLHDATWNQSLRKLPASNFGVSVFEFRVAYEWTSWHYNAAIRTKIDKQFISVHKSNLCRYLSVLYMVLAERAVTQCRGRTVLLGKTRGKTIKLRNEGKTALYQEMVTYRIA